MNNKMASIIKNNIMGQTIFVTNKLAAKMTILYENYLIKFVKFVLKLNSKKSFSRSSPIILSFKSRF